MTNPGLVERRRKVIENRDVESWAIPGALAEVTDQFLSDLYEREISSDKGIALVALGGYGRQELAPASDIDLMLIHDEREDADLLADRIWYPLWDEGFKLGHSVRSIDQTLRLAATDLETATSLLSGRCIAGDNHLVDRLLASNEKQWVEHGAARLEE